LKGYNLKGFNSDYGVFLIFRTKSEDKKIDDLENELIKLYEDTSIKIKFLDCVVEK
jgi:hypothetical protein